MASKRDRYPTPRMNQRFTSDPAQASAWAAFLRSGTPQPQSPPQSAQPMQMRHVRTRRKCAIVAYQSGAGGAICRLGSGWAMGRLPYAVTLVLTLGACSPYYTSLPKALTYDMEEVKRAPAQRPDPVVIASNELASIIATEARDVAVGPPRMGAYGWGFCLTAIVATNAGTANAVIWVTVYNPGIYGRRQAEPGDQCEFDRYIAIPPRRQS